MQRPMVKTLKRPQNTTKRTIRSSKEAAIELVRIEFEVSRLSLGIKQAEDRILTYNSELTQRLAQRRKLLNLLER